jgi:hypothetical protein
MNVLAYYTVLQVLTVKRVIVGPTVGVLELHQLVIFSVLLGRFSKYFYGCN